MDYKDDWQTAKEKAKGKLLIFTNGCFDIIHPGHIALLNDLRKNVILRTINQTGSKFFLLVGLNSDNSILKIKGKKPIMSYSERAYIIDNLKAVDGVVKFEQPTPLEIISFLKPYALGKGGDYKDKKIVGESIVLKSGGIVLKDFFIKGYSSGIIKHKINNQ